MFTIDPAPADRQHAPVVAKHPKFTHIQSKLASVKREQLPAHIDWIVSFTHHNYDPFLTHTTLYLYTYTHIHIYTLYLYTYTHPMPIHICTYIGM